MITIAFFSLLILSVSIFEIESIRQDKRSVFGVCISDKECKPTEYCDHHLPNPFGDCKTGYKIGGACIFDRHCSSKHCHLLKCVNRKAVKNGPCEKYKHDECIPEQFCNKDKCKDRKCSGWCLHNYECSSGNCDFFRCRKLASC